MDIYKDGYVYTNYSCHLFPNERCGIPTEEKWDAKYPFPQPHPFKDNEDVTGRWQTRPNGNGDIIAIPIDPEKYFVLLCKLQPTPSADDDYWERRCKAAEKFIEETPCDPDIHDDQINAYNAWQELVNQSPNQ